MVLFPLADKWRVLLKSEVPDYIHASFANVSISHFLSSNIPILVHLHIHRATSRVKGSSLPRLQ